MFWMERDAVMKKNVARRVPHNAFLVFSARQILNATIFEMRHQQLDASRSLLRPRL
jgi:hypothetical protein